MLMPTLPRRQTALWPRPAEADFRPAAAAAWRAAAARGLTAGAAVPEVATGLGLSEGALLAACAGPAGTGTPLRVVPLGAVAARRLHCACEPPATVELAGPGLMLSGAASGLTVEPGAVAQVFALEREGAGGGATLVACDASGARLLALDGVDPAVWRPWRRHGPAGVVNAGRAWRSDAGPSPAARAPERTAGLPLPDGALGELLLRAAQAGLVLRTVARVPGAALVLESACERLHFDGLHLVAAGAAGRLLVDESTCPEAWCATEVRRSGLRHRVELRDATRRLHVAIEEAAPPDRPESCGWRALVQSLLPAGGRPC